MIHIFFWYLHYFRTILANGSSSINPCLSEMWNLCSDFKPKVAMCFKWLQHIIVLLIIPDCSEITQVIPIVVAIFAGTARRKTMKQWIINKSKQPESAFDGPGNGFSPPCNRMIFWQTLFFMKSFSNCLIV